MNFQAKNTNFSANNASKPVSKFEFVFIMPDGFQLQSGCFHQNSNSINIKFQFMKRLLFVIYGILCYVIFFSTFLYMIGFIENFSGSIAGFSLSALFPTTLDHGSAEVPLFQAVIINLLLIGLFGIQHSAMARWKFKQKWIKYIPRPVERSTYVLFASLALIIMFYCWQPVNTLIWNLKGTTAGETAMAISWAGWGMLLLSTFLINHFDLFGLRQVILNAFGKDYSKIRFRTPLLYKMVRHPLYLSFLLIFWFAPVMTIGHLVFAAGMTGNLIIGMNLEERDLVQLYGEKYQEYRETVPKIIPFVKPVSKTDHSLETSEE